MILSFIPALQMSLSSMEEDIIGGLTPATEPQLNIMHTTYLLMQCCSEFSAADVAKQFYSVVHSKYFSEESSVSTCIHLAYSVASYKCKCYVLLDAEQRHVPTAEGVS